MSEKNTLYRGEKTAHLGAKQERRFSFSLWNMNRQCRQAIMINVVSIGGIIIKYRNPRYSMRDQILESRIKVTM